ncbi:tetrapyrrole biosynthesis, uroporphyrinogen III synthase [Phycomyces blakesleeanus]|uniref:Tetrapyrrole biosynthesis uroporphyrinogen III synthase domain-containing protein n=2 Tax=Phycomyces blakesleeanus TaxID=4837 RepID=A0A167MTC6_PHYB8|nr:hypothetical protein PHYBLDRAFT_64848 [Phycomyces blakesleeanus NRRL 1555(-)]OAD73894.1 hypothetical protein PHYBLDRAFT_64848 [Phycomyces blakesleeanus NRRL 1555(-)]|eukprot:XP_018291934.1 hypothetical protein PHYBLDRAFT_64848 [Phycomyces blakesleeanus NRRL 1555(-)]
MSLPQTWVFKVKAIDKPDDYDVQFTKHGYPHTFIPVLDHKSTSLQTLAEIFSLGPIHCNHLGLVITSQRAVETISRVLWTLNLSPEVRAAWSALPIFVVGPRTANDLRQIALFSNSNLTIADMATELCDAIEARYPNHKDQSINQSLLFLSGDKRRDVIPRRMAKASIKVHEIKAYETCPHPLLDQSLRDINPSPEDWAVYFSPSGIRYVCQSIKQLPITKLAAIGPTTAEYLEKELGLKVHVVADHPDAVHLVNSMATYDASST